MKVNSHLLTQLKFIVGVRSPQLKPITTVPVDILKWLSLHL